MTEEKMLPLSDALLQNCFASVIRCRSFIIAFSLLLLIPALYGITQIRLDSSTENFIVKNDPKAERYERFIKLFGNDETLFILIPTNFHKITGFQSYRNLAEKLLQREEITAVFSPFELYDRYLTGNKRKLNRLRNILKENPESTVNALIRIPEKGEGKGFIAFAAFVNITDPAQRSALYTDTLSLLQQEGFNLSEVTVAGAPALNHFLGETPRKDARIFFPLLGLFSALLLFGLFRHYVPLLLSFCLIAETLILTLGALGLSGGRFTILSNILPAVLYIVSFAALIHLLYPLMHPPALLRTKEETRSFLIQVLCEKFRPCLFSAVTTAAGFASLGVSEVEPVRQLGFFLALGVLISFMLLLTLFPALASFFIPLGKSMKKEEGAFSLFPLSSYCSLLREYRLILFLFPLLVLSCGIFFLPSIPFQTNGLLYFPEESSIRQGNRAIEAEGIATRSVEVILSASSPLFSKRDALEELAELDKNLLALPQVVQVHSVAEILLQLNSFFFSIPFLPAEEATETLYAKAEKHSPALISRFITDDRSSARISVGINDMEYEQFSALQKEIQNVLAISSLARKCTIEISGQYGLIMNIQHYLVQTLSMSLLISFMVVSFCFYLLFRRFSFALLALLPNLYPVFATLLLLYITSMSFDVANIMIAGIILGIVVDSTAHFLYRYQQSRQSGLSKEQAVVQTLDTTGRAVLLSGIVLATGFMVLSFSGFIPTAHFGMLSSFSLLNGIIGDLLILPALLFLFAEE